MSEADITHEGTFYAPGSVKQATVAELLERLGVEPGSPGSAAIFSESLDGQPLVVVIGVGEGASFVAHTLEEAGLKPR